MGRGNIATRYEGSSHVDVETIKDTWTVDAVLRRHGIDWPARRRRGPCVFHDGRNPSALSLRADGRVGCHACGWKGSAIDVEMRLGRCGLGTAVQNLAAAAGLAPAPVDHAALDRRRRETARRERLRSWRNATLRMVIDQARELESTARWAHERLTAYRTAGNAWGEAKMWELLVEVHAGIELADWCAVQLTPEDEAAWARLRETGA